MICSVAKLNVCVYKLEKKETLAESEALLLRFYRFFVFCIKNGGKADEKNLNLKKLFPFYKKLKTGTFCKPVYIKTKFYQKREFFSQLFLYEKVTVFADRFKGIQFFADSKQAGKMDLYTKGKNLFCEGLVSHQTGQTRLSLGNFVVKVFAKDELFCIYAAHKTTLCLQLNQSFVQQVVVPQKFLKNASVAADAFSVTYQITFNGLFYLNLPKNNVFLTQSADLAGFNILLTSCFINQKQPNQALLRTHTAPLQNTFCLAKELKTTADLKNYFLLVRCARVLARIGLNIKIFPLVLNTKLPVKQNAYPFPKNTRLLTKNISALLRKHKTEDFAFCYDKGIMHFKSNAGQKTFVLPLGFAPFAVCRQKNLLHITSAKTSFYCSHNGTLSSYTFYGFCLVLHFKTEEKEILFNFGSVYAPPLAFVENKPNTVIQNNIMQTLAVQQNSFLHLVQAGEKNIAKLLGAFETSLQENTNKTLLREAVLKLVGQVENAKIKNKLYKLIYQLDCLPQKHGGINFEEYIYSLQNGLTNTNKCSTIVL